jgi:hypothetical protein
LMFEFTLLPSSRFEIAINSSGPDDAAGAHAAGAHAVRYLRLRRFRK